jgi:hypothetical protein
MQRWDLSIDQFKSTKIIMYPDKDKTEDLHDAFMAFSDGTEAADALYIILYTGIEHKDYREFLTEFIIKIKQSEIGNRLLKEM